ncbi:putative transcription factor Hap3/NF-YB family [Rosa chinensis]|uniref:Putative transcription factor Hap3/NF-YB family n=1 Tax=Rosa chinensis TaxID=74649 RepID=A0A2P6QHI5_ROSCH|nr:chromatin accessibility complex protein 1 [Rosa chinensis]PRQ33630.1 putative transcription factor Hap3/NF-YB family [Rosa chinensis]
MATPKKGTPPKKTKEAQKPSTKSSKNDGNKIKKKTGNGTAAAAAAVRSPSSKPQKSREQNGGKSTKTPTPKSKKPQQNGKRVREEEVEEKEDVKSYTFPMERVKRIIRAEDSDLRISSDAVFLVNKATEKFLEKLSEDAHKCCVKDRKKALAYKHLSSVVCKQKRYEFLSDFVPEKIKAGDALAKRKQTQEGTS